MDLLSLNPMLPSILSYVDAKYLTNCRQVCRRFCDTIENNWRTMQKFEIPNLSITIYKKTYPLREEIGKFRIWSVPDSRSIIFSGSVQLKAYVSGILPLKRRNSRKRRNNETVSKYVENEHAPTFEMANKMEGYGKITQILQERFKVFALDVNGNKLNSSDLHLLSPCAKSVEMLDASMIPFNENTLALCRNTVAKEISVYFTANVDNRLFQLNLSTTKILVESRDLNHHTVQTLIENWASGTVDIFDLTFAVFHHLPFSLAEFKTTLENCNLTFTFRHIKQSVYFELKRVNSPQKCVLWVEIPDFHGCSIKLKEIKPL